MQSRGVITTTVFWGGRTTVLLSEWHRTAAERGCAESISLEGGDWPFRRKWCGTVTILQWIGTGRTAVQGDSMTQYNLGREYEEA
jgi:hypothetical protein